MIVSSHVKLDPSYWKIQSGNLKTGTLCANDTEFFVIDPSVINSLGGSKEATLDPILLKTNSAYVTDSGWSQPELGFRDSTWISFGWSVDDEALFFSELSAWIVNNFSNNTINIDLDNFNLITVRGAHNSENYTAAFCYPGS